jgi:small-conductance mechanosensitive channel
MNFIFKDLFHFSAKDMSANIILSIIAVIVITGLYNFIRYIISHHIRDIVEKQYYRKFSLYISIGIALTLLFLIWFDPIRNTILIISAFGMGFVLGFKELIMCISGRILLAMSQEFQIGNRIEIGNITGDVIDIGIMSTAIAEIGGIIAGHQSSGRIIHVPNSLLLTTVIKNYTKKCDYVWDELIVRVGVTAEHQAIEKILYSVCEEIVGHTQEDAEKEMKRLGEEFAYKMPKLTPFVYYEMEASEVLLTLRYLVKIRERRNIRHAMIVRILGECKHMGIKL